MRRVYPRYGYQQQGDVERGLQVGKQIGGLIGDLGTAIQTAQKNKIANQLMNEQGMQNLPPAQSLGKLPADGTDQPMDLSGYGGSGPTVADVAHTGGVAEMQMRQQIAKQQAADALSAANLANVQAQTGLRSAQARRARMLPTEKAAKPGKYVPGSSDPNDPASDDFNKLQADFEAQHGKGSYAAITRNLANLKPDPDRPGQWSIIDPATGKAVLGTDNVTPKYSIAEQDLNLFRNRYEATRIKAGQGRLTPLPDGINMGSGQKPGTQINPIQWDGKNPLMLRTLPDGTYVQLPDGSVKPIQRSARPQQQAQPQTAAAEPDTTSTDQAADQTEEDVNAQ